jgi:predicted SnoaL-like aldol condensation-catalyzing enzyme
LTTNPEEKEIMLRSLSIACAVALSSLVNQGAWAADTAQLEANKKIVVDFYEQGINQKDFEAAAKHLGPQYIQHNPGVPDGIEGFKSLVKILRERAPKHRSEIKRVFADGDFVILHVHSIPQPGAKGAAIVDIFRLENGKIVEHWDVRQDITDRTANKNGMF